MGELGVEEGPVAGLGIRDVAPGVSVDGPVAELGEVVFELHRLRQGRVCGGKE
jgi:hypothetical protein